jgi:hypothetical protein
MILGKRDAIERAFEGQQAVTLLGPDEPIPESATDPTEPPYLCVRVDPTQDRAQVPSQRTHAGIIYSLLSGVLGEFGEESAAILTVDPAAHLGPRRVWMISPVVDVEVVGTWTVEDLQGEPVEDVPVPDSRTVRADSVLLPLPGIDPSSLDALLEECSLAGIARPAKEGGAVVYDADKVVDQSDGWRSFVEKVAGWIPEEHTSFAVWRVQGAEHLAILRRDDDVRWLKLVPCWPDEQDDLELPLSPQVQMLGRALFQAPRSGRYLGTRPE